MTVKAILEQGGRVVLRGRARLGLFSLSYGIYRIESKVSGPKKRLIIFTSPPNPRRRDQAHCLEDALPPTPKDTQLLNIGTTLLRKKYPKKKRGEDSGVIYYEKTKSTPNYVATRECLAAQVRKSPGGAEQLQPTSMPAYPWGRAKWRAAAQRCRARACGSGCRGARSAAQSLSTMEPSMILSPRVRRAASAA